METVSEACMSMCTCAASAAALLQLGPERPKEDIRPALSRRGGVSIMAANRRSHSDDTETDFIAISDIA